MGQSLRISAQTSNTAPQPAQTNDTSRLQEQVVETNKHVIDKSQLLLQRLQIVQAKTRWLAKKVVVRRISAVPHASTLAHRRRAKLIRSVTR